MKNFRLFSLAPAVLGIFLTAAPPCRGAEWGVPIGLGGVKNLHQVAYNLYCGAQPTPEGFRNLERLGVRTIVNLRAFHGDNLSGTALKEIRIKMNALLPEEEDAVMAMRVLSDPEGGPYFVHCMDGGRTGVIIAIYRMVVQDWSREDAIDEMTSGNYGFYALSMHLRYLEQIDVLKIRRLIGIPEPGRMTAKIS